MTETGSITWYLCNENWSLGLFQNSDLQQMNCLVSGAGISAHSVILFKF